MEKKNHMAIVQKDDLTAQKKKVINRLKKKRFGTQICFSQIHWIFFPPLHSCEFVKKCTLHKKQTNIAPPRPKKNPTIFFFFKCPLSCFTKT